MLLLGGAATGALLRHEAEHFEKFREKREARSRQAVQAGRQGLIDYMLLRAESGLAIAQGNAASIAPRLLMLPCPDNIGDGNLDGSQDPTCGAASSPAVLDSGSRFGRLPWRSRNINAVSNSLNDGIDVSARDSGNNRLWYAVARNMAPAADGLPLNMHRLVTQKDGWLQVVNARGQNVNEKIAAVILAPGAATRPRFHESALATLTLSHAVDVAAATGQLAPSRYFETYTVVSGGATLQVRNDDNDGVFVQGRPRSGQAFNDELAYISMEKLLDARQYFLLSYAQFVGVTPLQNAPGKDRPLDNIAQALQAHRALLGFYPPPARQETAAHLSQRERHCAAYHSGDLPRVAALTVRTPLAAARAVTVHTAIAASTATVTLSQPAAFLLHRHAVAAAGAVAVVGDMSLTVAALTLARHARLTLQSAVLEVTTGGLQAVASTAFRLPAGEAVALLSAVVVTVSPRTPLRPQGHLTGWLAEHARPHQRAGNDGQTFNLQADTRAMFWAPARLGALTVGSDAVLTLGGGSALRLEEDVAQRQHLDAVVFHADGTSATVSSALPAAQTYEQRQFAVWLLADAVRNPSSAIEAPALVFPWRRKIQSSADSRDNLHDYPPCLDARNFFGQQFRNALQDQTMLYAVAEECHYGGDPAACGARGGLTVSVAAGAEVALPHALTLTSSYTVTVGNFLTLALQDGAVQNTADVTLIKNARLPLLDGGGATLAALRLPAGHRFASGGTVVMPAQTPLIAGARTVIENVPALLIYSPAPLPRVPCSSGMPPAAIAGTLAIAPPLVLANQRAEADDITNFCYWVDDAENADGDGFYVIYAQPPHRAVSPRNDFFVLLGGRVRLR